MGEGGLFTQHSTLALAMYKSKETQDSTILPDCCGSVMSGVLRGQAPPPKKNTIWVSTSLSGSSREISGKRSFANVLASSSEFSGPLEMTIARKGHVHYIDWCAKLRCCSPDNPITWLGKHTYVTIGKKKQYVLRWFDNHFRNPMVEKRYTEHIVSQQRGTTSILMYVWLVVILYAILTAWTQEDRSDAENAWYSVYVLLRIVPNAIVAVLAMPFLFRRENKTLWPNISALVFCAASLSIMISGSFKHGYLITSLDNNLRNMLNAINSTVAKSTVQSITGKMLSDPVSLDMGNEASLQINFLAVSTWLQKYTLILNRLYPVGATLLTMLFVRQFHHCVSIAFLNFVANIIATTLALGGTASVAAQVREALWVGGVLLAILFGAHTWDKNDRIHFLYSSAVDEEMHRLRQSLSEFENNKLVSPTHGVGTRLGHMLKTLGELQKLADSKMDFAMAKELDQVIISLYHNHARLSEPIQSRGGSLSEDNDEAIAVQSMIYGATNMAGFRDAKEEGIQRATSKSLDTIRRTLNSASFKLKIGAVAFPEYSEFVQKVGEWDLDVLRLDKTSKRPLLIVGMTIARKERMLKRFMLSESNWADFLNLIESGYMQENAYHNRAHAADVTNSVYTMTKNLSLYQTPSRGKPSPSKSDGDTERVYKSSDFFSAIVAAVVHDYKHPGLNNGYIVRTGSPIALRYLDDAVLERYHIAEAFLECKKNPAADIFANMEKQDYQTIRELIISLVLATDMKGHFGFVETLSAAVSTMETEKGNNPESYKFDLVTHKNILLKMIMKSSDIGHCAKPWEFHRKWSMLVCEEFYRQGEQELQEGVEPLAHMDRRKDETLPKNQIGFIKFFAVPLHEKMSALCPALSYIKQHVHDNIAEWQKLADMAGKKWNTREEMEKASLWRDDLQPIATTVNVAHRKQVFEQKVLRSNDLGDFEDEDDIGSILLNRSNSEEDAAATGDISVEMGSDVSS